MVIHHIRNGSALGFAALGSFFMLLPTSVHESLGLNMPIAVSSLLGLALLGLAFVSKVHPKVYA